MPSELIFTQDGTNPPNPGANEVTLFAKAGNVYAVSSGGAVQDLNVVDDVVILEYEVTAGTNGGSAVAAVWENRPINSIAVDTGSIVSLGANQFVLPSGTYEFQIITSHYFTNRTRVRLFNVTDSVIIQTSGTPILPSGVSGVITFVGRFTLTASKTLSIQQYVQTAAATSGMGVAANIAGITEIHLQAMLRRVAL